MSGAGAAPQGARGVGSTMSQNRPGRRGRGYRYYRLTASADAGVTDGGRGRVLARGVGHYRNPDRVVAPVRLSAGGRALGPPAGRRSRAVRAAAAVDGGLVGPFRLHANDAAALSVSGGALRRRRRAPSCALRPGGEFYLRPRAGRATVTVTATCPQRGEASAVASITGVARDDVNNRLTPVALAVPAPVVGRLPPAVAARRPSGVGRTAVAAVGG